jgi:hypothetical protein
MLRISVHHFEMFENIFVLKFQNLDSTVRCLRCGVSPGALSLKPGTGSKIMAEGWDLTLSEGHSAGSDREGGSGAE